MENSIAFQVDARKAVMKSDTGECGIYVSHRATHILSGIMWILQQMEGMCEKISSICYFTAILEQKC